MDRIRVLFVAVIMSVCACAAFGGGLEVLSANPQGEIDYDRSQIGFEKIQILFSEPMVSTLQAGNEQNALPGFITITPAFAGKAYWGSDRALDIIPADRAKVPLSTRYVVTVKKGAKSLSGQELGQDYVFSFTTPTLKIESVRWLRNGDSYDSPVIFAIYFNQPVDRNQVLGHLTVSTEPSPFPTRNLTPEGMTEVAKREPEAARMFSQKYESVMKAVGKGKALQVFMVQNRSEKVESFLKYNFKYVRGGFSEDRLLLVGTAMAPPLQAKYMIRFDIGTRPIQGNAGPDKPLEFKIDGPDAFFLLGEDSSYNYGHRNTYTTSEDPSLMLSKPFDQNDFLGKIKCFDLTDDKEIPLTGSKEGRRRDQYISLGSLGFVPVPGHHYLFRIDPGFRAADGEPLGYPAYQSFNFTLSEAYVSFGEGEGVWESSRGTMVPFYAKNVKKTGQMLCSISDDEIVPLLKDSWADDPEGYYDGVRTPGKMKEAKAEEREIKGFRPDKVFNAGLELKPYLNREGKGIVWASIELKEPFGDAPVNSYWDGNARRALIQVTDLGITLKYSPEECLIYVTSLSSAQPVAGCQVEVRDMDNRVVAAGVTDDKGLLKIDKAPFTVAEEDRDEEYDRYISSDSRLFAVIAKKGGDTTYIVNNWAGGAGPWSFDIPFNWNLGVTRKSSGMVFTDRGVYKLGEEVHYKAILRKVVMGDLGLFDEGSEVTVEIVDPKGKVKESRKTKLSSMSSLDGVFTIPGEATLGSYRVEITAGQDQHICAFRVAAYRKPDFRVNAELSSKEGTPSLEGKVSASYLFGAPLAGGSVKYHFEGGFSRSVPKEIEDLFPGENWSYTLSWVDREKYEDMKVEEEGEKTLDPKGELTLPLPAKDGPVPMYYALEAEVTDVTRQSIAADASTVIYPAYFIGLFQGRWTFGDYRDGLRTKVVVVARDGKIVPGADVEVELSKIVYKSTNSATGERYYEWESKRELELVEKRNVKSADAPLDLSFNVPSGGQYVVRARTKLGNAEQLVSSYWWFYGGDYTPWERSSDNKIEVMVESQKYKPGETAKLLIKSPWEKGQVLMTTERETVRSFRTFELTSTQQMVEIKLTEDDIPNIFVSFILIKGRSGEDENDKPAFRIGYAKISVENEKKKLNVAVSSDKEEYRPAEKAKVKATVTDSSGKPVRGAEVTLWAVDVGVLNLTDYKTPEPSSYFWAERRLSVFNADSRDKIISARVSSPKGEDEGGGGGMEYGQTAQIRKDFRVLAFWVGSAMTGENGSFEGEFLLPESLTAFRIMAVAHDRSSRFGSAEKEFRISQKLLLTPAFPRFLTVGDDAYAGTLLNSRLSAGGTARVKIESLTPDILAIEDGEKTMEISTKGKAEVRCRMKGLVPGIARIRVTAGLLEEKDAFEMELPVNYPLEKASRIQCGEFRKETSLSGDIPENIYANLGELEVTVSQNVVAELKEGYNFVVEYPYGCAEQRSSRLIVLLNNYTLARLIGKTGDMDETAKKVIVKGIRGLAPFQREDGGFGVWAGDRASLPYLTAYICHLLQRAKEEGLLPHEGGGMLDDAMKYLGEYWKQEGAVEEKYHCYWHGSNAFAAKVLAEGGGNADQLINLMMENLSKLPSGALCNLWDAAVRSGKAESAGKIEAAIRARIIMSGQSSYLKEIKDDYYYYYWLGDDVATAMALRSFVSNTKDSDMQYRLAKYLVEKGRSRETWNTYNNANTFEALAFYVRKQQAAPKCVVSCFIGDWKVFETPLGEKQGFDYSRKVPMGELLGKARGNYTLKLSSDTAESIHYSVKLRYAPVGVILPALDRGITVRRSYTAIEGEEAKTSFTAGEMVEVHLELTVPDKSYNVAVVDPLPAGFEVLDSSFATTAKKLKSMETNEDQENEGGYGYYYDWWWYSGFRQIEKHDDKVFMFADYLSPGTHKFTYIVRATSSGEFRAASPTAEEMYDSSVNGRGQGIVIKVSDGKGR